MIILHDILIPSAKQSKITLSVNGAIFLTKSVIFWLGI